MLTRQISNAYNTAVKNSKVLQVLFLFTFLAVLLFLISLPRLIFPGSFVRIETAWGPGEIFVDHQIVSRNRMPVFLAAGKHHLELRLRWQAPFHQDFSVTNSWFPFGRASIVTCFPECSNPHETLDQALSHFITKNLSLVALPNFFWDRYLMEYSALTVQRCKPSGRSELKELNSSWLATAWAAALSSNSRSEVLRSAMIVAGQGNFSPFGPSLLIQAVLLNSRSFAHQNLSRKLSTDYVIAEQAVRMGEWQDFIQVNPQWGPRQRPFLRLKNLADQFYLRSFEAIVDASRFNQHLAWRKLPVREVSWPSVTAYCNWLSSKRRHTYRLATTQELLAMPWPQRLDSEWVNDLWPDALNTVIDQGYWFRPFNLCLLTKPGGESAHLAFPKGSSGKNNGFRLVQLPDH